MSALLQKSAAGKSSAKWRVKSDRDSAAYAEHKARARQRQAEIAAAGQDIAPLPPCKNPDRRIISELSLRNFCENYFPKLFKKSWSRDHLKLIAKIERVISRHEKLALAMPRGSGKTTICEVAVLWAVLTGQHHFVYLVGATEPAAKKMMQHVKDYIEKNDVLLEDFPEVCYPIRMLDGEGRKTGGQRYYGTLTDISWGSSDEEIRLPTIAGSAASGAIIRVVGITGNIRGHSEIAPDGSKLRPSLVLVDDFQTDESAKSTLQCQERLGLINGAIAGLPEPGEHIAILVTCTIIRAHDAAAQLLDNDQNPMWQGECCPLVYEWPTSKAAEHHWAEYRKILEKAVREGDGMAPATAYYARHRGVMDEGAAVGWEERYDPASELSALQHAWNLRISHGEAKFWAEFQNAPQDGSEDGLMLSSDAVMQLVNSYGRCIVPDDRSQLTAFIDLSKKVLWYVVCAWRNDFTGSVIDYGAWPDQHRDYFTLDDVGNTMSMQFPGAGLESWLRQGLDSCLTHLLSREYLDGRGVGLRIGRVLIDSGWLPDTVYQCCRESPHSAVLMPSRGVGLGPQDTSMLDYRQRPGEQLGWNWLVSTAPTRAIRYVRFDTNHWKSFVMSRMAVPKGDPGRLDIFGTDPERHRMFADQVTAEHPAPTSGKGRRVDVWEIKPGRSDNHWFDGLVGCAVGASMSGVVLPQAMMRSPEPDQWSGGGGMSLQEMKNAARGRSRSSWRDEE